MAKTLDWQPGKLDPVELAELCKLTDSILDDTRAPGAEDALAELNRRTLGSFTLDDIERIPSWGEVDEFVRNAIAFRGMPEVRVSRDRASLLEILREVRVLGDDDEMSAATIARAAFLCDAFTRSVNVPYAASLADIFTENPFTDEEIVDFVLAYQPPRTADDVWVTARAWASDESTVRGFLGIRLLEAELEIVPIEELAELARRTHAGNRGLIRAHMKRIGLHVTPLPEAPAPEPPPIVAAPPPEPPPTRYVTHAKFGRGEVRERTGAGDQAKLRVAFDDGVERLLLERFLKDAS